MRWEKNQKRCHVNCQFIPIIRSASHVAAAQFITSCGYRTQASDRMFKSNIRMRDKFGLFFPLWPKSLSLCQTGWFEYFRKFHRIFMYNSPGLTPKKTPNKQTVISFQQQLLYVGRTKCFVIRPDRFKLAGNLPYVTTVVISECTGYTVGSTSIWTAMQFS